MSTADALTTKAALDAEIALREQGDARLSNFTGAKLVLGIPDGTAPLYSAHGALITLVDGDNLELSLWKLDNGKQRSLDIQDGGSSVSVNPTFLNFGDAAADGFLVTVSGAGALIQLDALSKWWTGDPGDGGPSQDIESSGSTVEFDHDRFATGIDVTRTYIGHISAAWLVLSSVRLRGRKAKVGVNP